MEEVFDELAGAFLYQLSEAGPTMTLPFLWPIGIARQLANLDNYPSQ
jgi:hypothetical protein